MSGGTELGRENFSRVAVGCTVSGGGQLDEVVDVNGITYVLAPKLKKNWRKAKQTMNDTLLREWNLPARIPTIEWIRDG